MKVLARTKSEPVNPWAENSFKIKLRLVVKNTYTELLLLSENLETKAMC